MKPTDWLKKEHRKAEQELQQAEQHLNRAKEKIAAIATMLKLYDEDQASQSLEQHTTSIGSAGKKKAPTIVGLAKRILKENPLTTRELWEALKEKGKVTTLNTVIVTMNRSKAKGFYRKNGRWYFRISDPQTKLLGEEKQEVMP